MERKCTLRERRHGEEPSTQEISAPLQSLLQEPGSAHLALPCGSVRYEPAGLFQSQLCEFPPFITRVSVRKHALPFPSYLILSTKLTSVWFFCDFLKIPLSVLVHFYFSYYSLRLLRNVKYGKKFSFTFSLRGEQLVWKHTELEKPAGVSSHWWDAVWRPCYGWSVTCFTFVREGKREDWARSLPRVCGP